MKTIHFTKMHGLGNDFMVVDNIALSNNPMSWPIKQWGDRYLGIGFDQLLVIEPSKKADFFCRILNADGSEAEQCGNGLRAVALYVQTEKLHPSSSMTIETNAGVFPVTILTDGQVRVAMGAPVVEAKTMSLALNPASMDACLLSMGNPHAIIKVNTVDAISIDKLGKEISALNHFPHGVNVGFIQVLDASHTRLRTYERGVGDTHACGSNACAAAAAGIINGWLNNKVSIEFRYGHLIIEWEGGSQPIYMTGPAVTVYKGDISI